MTLTENEIYQDKYREMWKASIDAETRRLEIEYENKGDLHPNVINARKEGAEIMLSTFREGREYTKEDVRLRCRDIGYSFSEDAIKSGLRSLISKNKLRTRKLPATPRGESPVAYRLAP